MGMKNMCCFGLLLPLTEATTGEEITCTCGNEFIHTGEAWRNVLNLGRAKVEKYRRVRRVNLLVQRNQPATS